MERTPTTPRLPAPATKARALLDELAAAASGRRYRVRDGFDDFAVPEGWVDHRTLISVGGERFASTLLDLQRRGLLTWEVERMAGEEGETAPAVWIYRATSITPDLQPHA